MNGRTITTITTGTIMTVGLGLGVGGGFIEAEYEYNAEMDKVENAQEEQSELREDQLELDRVQDETAADLGEACIRLMVQYSPSDGTIEETSENDILSDLLQAPGQPCGDTATDVRADVQNYIGSEVTIEEKQVRIDELETAIDDRQEDPEGRGFNQVQMLLGDGAFGLGVGLFVGSIAGIMMRDEYKRRDRYPYGKPGERTWKSSPTK